MQSYARFGVLKEFLILVAFLVGSYLITSTMDAFEVIHEFIHEYEWLDIDGLAISMVVLLIVHSIFSFRRWKVLEREVNKRTLELKNEVEERKIAEQKVRENDQRYWAVVEISEDASRESKDFLEKIIDSIPDPIFVKDSEHRFVLVNDAECRLAGVRREDLIGKTDYDFFPKEEVDVFWQKDEIVLTTGEENVNEEEITDSRGLKRAIVTKKILYTDNSGNRFIVGIIRDITSRKFGEASLRESERRFREVMENVKLIAVMLESEGNVSFCNDYFLALTGYEREEVIGRTWFDMFIPPEMCDEITHLYREQVFSGNIPAHYHNEILTRVGKRRLIAWNNTLLRNAQGEIIGCTSIGEDITDRVKAQEALKESEERFRLVVENAPDAIFVQTESRFAYLNPAAARLFGASSTESLLGQAIMERIHPDYRKCIGERIRALNEERRPVPMIEERIIRLDGTVLDTEVSAVPFTYDNKIAALVFMRDITERKKIEAEKAKLESQLRHSQKIEAMGTLAGGIAHDFNNILGTILGYTEMTLLDLPERSPLKHNLEQVLKASGRARDLVRQILIFSRQTHAQEKSLIDIRPIIEEAVRFLRASLPATIEIRQSLTSDSCMALADATQIHQVLINLCTNAAHATEHEAGLIEISLKRMELNSADVLDYPDLRPGSYLDLAVSDAGHGMDKATIDRIFDPFFTTKEVGKGTGLGLAVVHGVVKRHEGAITVESAPGRGSTFHVLLPRVEANSKDEAVSDDSLPMGMGRVLYVDDEQSLVDIGTRMLRLLGYEPVGMTSSMEALEAFRSSPYELDLVVTDYTMPGMTGAALATEILRIRPNIPILLATGFSETITEDRAKEIGIRELVIKPLSMRDLAEAVQRALGG